MSYSRYSVIIHNYIICNVVRYRQTTPSLISLSPLLAGKIDHLHLEGVLINCACGMILMNSLTSPHCSLCKLSVYRCSFSSGVYNSLITAIATSKLTYFATDYLDIDVTRAKVLAS